MFIAVVQGRDNGGWDQGQRSGNDSEKCSYLTVLKDNFQGSLNGWRGGKDSVKDVSKHFLFTSYDKKGRAGRKC